ncbi:unnamed protein product [Candidula unifasciata]|uniref:Sulfotransferase n=1 Tax=Candidula unifasciata TaxID=100452 RepID=A0A8S3Z2U7_9EUPU|nr:unnamed protein product [Candidula unifasciata]
MYYEPLHNFAKLFASLQEDYTEVRHKYLHLTAIPEYNRKALDILERLMTCNYQHLPRAVTLNIHMRLYDTAQMFWCMKRANTTEKQAICLKEGEAKCKAKSLHFLKVIRLSTKSVGQLMDKHPCLKMIYLVRDPRGNFLSKQRAFNFITANTAYEAERYCTRVNKDITHALRLKRKYPERVHLTRYEDIAESPITTARQLYSFLNLTFTESVARFIYNNTQAGLGDRRVYTLTRGNSSEVSYAWRSKIKLADVKAFDAQCKDVYFKLGYLPVSSEPHLRNQNIPLKFDKSYIT